MQISSGNPTALLIFAHNGAFVSMEGEFEVRESLFENPDGLLDFNIHFRFFLDSVS